MDKYTYSLKVEKIGKLVRQEDYAQAAKIADTMEWGQERNVRLLTIVGDAYEKTGQYTKAIDVLLTAYERSPIGKRIMYKLTELAIASGDLEDAETFYKKYLQEASDENNRFILRYKIAEAKGEDLEKRIAILESYKKHEFDEEWACRLAELYQEAGREEECVALCDEIILWFGVGPYVDRAMELKESFRPLTDAQREHRENKEYFEAKVKAVANEMAEAVEKKTASLGLPREEEAEPAEEETVEEELPVIAISDEGTGSSLLEAEGNMLAPEPDLPAIPEEDFEEAEPESSDTRVLEEIPKEELRKASGASAAGKHRQEKASAGETDDLEDIMSEVEDEFLEDELPEEDLPAADVQETVLTAPEEDLEDSEDTEDSEDPEEPEEEKAEDMNLEAAPEEEPAPAPKERPASKAEKASAGEAAAKAPAAPGKTGRRMPELTMPEISEEDPEDWQEEEKEGGRAIRTPVGSFKLPKMPDIRNIGKNHKTESALPEPAIPPKEADPMELEEAINAALEAESQREQDGYAEEKAPKSKEEMAITRNLKNLLRRTLGNITVPPPEDMGETQEFTIPRKLRKEKEAEPADKSAGKAAAAEEAAPVREARRPHKAPRPQPEEAAAKTAPARKAPAAPPVEPDTLDEFLNSEERQAAKKNRQEEHISLAEDANVLPVISYDETERAAWEQHASRRIEPEPKKPLESREMERCIFIEAVGEEGVNRAVDALDAYYQARNREVGAIAKITGEKLNRRGLIKSLQQLNGKDLIIDRADTLSNELIQEILRVIERLDPEKVFVLLDEAADMPALKERVTAQLLATTSIAEESRPKKKAQTEEVSQVLEETKTNDRARRARKVKPLSFDRMDPRQELSRADFLRYADYYARTLQCTIDDTGFDALEDEIDLIRQEGGKLLAGEVEDIIEDAAESASRPSLRRVFGAKYDREGFLILRDRNFT